MKIASSPTRDKYPLSTRKIIKKSLGSWIGLFVIGGIVATISGVISESFGPVVPIMFVVFLLMVLSYFYQKWYFAVYYYDLTEDYIVIRKHPITPHEINVPYERIQDIYMDQDIWDRIFRIYDVHISSATFSSGMVAHIDGLAKEHAEGLKNEMLSIVKQKIQRRPAQQQQQQPQQPTQQAPQQPQMSPQNGTNI